MTERAPDHSSEDRLIIHNLVRTDLKSSFSSDVRDGLTAQPKRLFPKIFAVGLSPAPSSNRCPPSDR